MKKVLFILVAAFMFQTFGWAQQELSMVSKAIDGNTLELSTGEHVRLIGVELPADNADVTRQFLEKITSGKEIRLAFDQGVEQKDSSGNLMAYVYIPSTVPNDFPIQEISLIADYAYFVNGEKYKETFLNAMVIRAGRGTLDENASFSFKDEFKNLEREAQDQKRGIWAS